MSSFLFGMKTEKSFSIFNYQFSISPDLPHDDGRGNGGVQGFAVGVHGDDELMVGIFQNFLPDAPALAADDQGHIRKPGGADIHRPVT